MLDKMREYQKPESKDLRILVSRTEEGVVSQLMVIQTPFGYRRVAEMFRPEGDGSFPAILYVHWYEPESISSHRTQFEAEALEMARKGAICMSIETLWSDRDFFLKRTQEDDMQNSMEEVVNIRRAMDVLLSQPNVDSKRFAYVGHDFGGMYGVLAGSLDQRPTHYVIMASTPRFPDWYLYLPRLEGDARESFLREMSPIDPITHIANLSPARVLFQFASDDFHVPKERAEEFFAAAREPREMKWYDAKHGLNEESTNDRKTWLMQNLALS
jgi:dienelactone hydrolase